jgi:hypothetical protein
MVKYGGDEQPLDQIDLVFLERGTSCSYDVRHFHFLGCFENGLVYTKETRLRSTRHRAAHYLRQ